LNGISLLHNGLLVAGCSSMEGYFYKSNNMRFETIYKFDKNRIFIKIYKISAKFKEIDMFLTFKKINFANSYSQIIELSTGYIKIFTTN